MSDAAPSSVWLTANAGSGKTRALTNRVTRLLLAGTPPERILCLTYTKAAATEMQNRLLSRLGEWAMLPEAKLRAELAEIGAEAGGDLAEARRLFARAIETPGGLKVQTIHAFCASILRRFPLEAGVPHGFAELDGRSAAALRAEILDQMAEAGAPEVADLTAIHSGHDLDGFLAALTAADAQMKGVDEAGLLAFAGLAPGDSMARLLAETFAPGDADLLDDLAALAGSGKATDVKLAEALAQGDWNAPGTTELAILEGRFLFGAGAKAPFAAKLGAVPTKDLRARLPDPEGLDALMLRVQDARPRRIALDFVARTLALHRFGAAFATRYQAAKAAQGWLDFDDLIARAEALLSTPDMAPWVLFRLDGGIDHILVDEAQDTSPRQWQVIRHLTDEFMAGEDGRNRTLFVVGDPKQSIYSFQGADIAVFEDRHASFAAGFAAAQAPMRDAALLRSFRSSPAILRLVDAVFAGEAAQGLGGPPEHIPFHEAMPGRVDLWPVVEKPETPPEGEWDDPMNLIRPEDAPARLSEAVAEAVAGMLGQPIRDRHGVTRPIRAGDVLILVQRRSDLFHQIIAALKRRALPVAGADRLKLGGEVAVRDIRALLAFLATPEDDLSLAEALRSPLFGLSEDALFRLAAGRGASLWAEVREAAPEATRAVLSDMLGQTGYLRPYELISRILIRHGGRERLIARLGAEAEDGIDELLSQALAYERTETPSLTGFLVWLEGDEVEVRRQPGSASDGEGLVRVMTVHGSKGLESPIVLVPDGAIRGRGRRAALVIRRDGPAVLRGRQGERPEALEDEIAAQEQAAEEERRRLLYVALTRAESWLIVAAAGEAGEGTDSWHAMTAAGMDALGAEAVATPLGAGRRHAFGDWPETVPARDAAQNAAQDTTHDAARDTVRDADCDAGGASGSRSEPPAHAFPPAPPVAPPTPLPDWLREQPPAITRPPRPVAATALGGAKALPGTESDADALLTGTRLHLLLEHWADLAGPDDARDLLAGAEGGVPDDASLAALWDEAAAVAGASALAHLFAPMSAPSPDAPDPATAPQMLTEVALTAPLPGIGILHGTIDRLHIGADRVLAIDYKSNALVPDTPEAVPDGILRQMAAYRAALAAIWPDRRIEMAVLWIAARSLMVLPDAVMDGVLAGLDPPPPAA